MQLQIRPLHHSDAEAYWNCTFDEQIYKFVRGFYCQSFLQAQILINELLSNSEFEPYVIEVDNKLVGCIILKNISNFELEVSYFVAKPYRRKGYAYEALNHIIKKYNGCILYFYIENQNIASKNLLQKLHASQKITDNTHYYIFARKE